MSLGHPLSISHLLQVHQPLGGALLLELIAAPLSEQGGGLCNKDRYRGGEGVRAAAECGGREGGIS